MTNESYYTLFEEIIEDLQGGGKDSLTKTISTLMNVAMKSNRRKLCRLLRMNGMKSAPANGMGIKTKP
jgi:hypothetical protein